MIGMSVTTRAGFTRSPLSSFFGSTHTLWQLVFYGVPLALMLWISLHPAGEAGVAAYSRVFRTSRYAGAIINSAQLGLIAAVAAVAAGLPLAYILDRHIGPRLRPYLLLVLVLPFLSSYVLRMYGWQAWFSNQGIGVWLVRLVFGFDAPGILFTQAASVLGLLSVLLPIATLIIYLTLARTDPALVAAARNLGATAWVAFVRIELPFLVPAILISAQFCFLLAFGDFVAVSILGGNRTYYYSIAVQDQMKIDDWPAACALGTVLLLLSLAAMAVTFNLVGRSRVARLQAPGDP